MARVLIIGGNSSAVEDLTGALEREGHVVRAVVKADRGSLEHVAIVCWLADGSPEGFLLGAIDSSMRGFVYRASASEGSNAAAWERSVLDTAARNAIPVATLRADPDDAAWSAEARAAVASLLEGPR